MRLKGDLTRQMELDQREQAIFEAKEQLTQQAQHLNVLSTSLSKAAHLLYEIATEIEAESAGASKSGNAHASALTLARAKEIQSLLSRFKVS